MTDLERFFERMVRNLVVVDPSRVSRPIPLAELKSDILPYRTNRRALKLESTEEYEELLMRLVSGQEELVSVAPAEVAEWCQRQLSSLTPDLSGIPGQATATLQVNPAAIARILGEAAAAGLAKAGTGAPAPKNLPLPPDKCPNCDAGLPPNRAISFCPACGRSVTAVPCDACGADMEPGWRFCVDCGHEAGETAPVQT